MREGLRGPGHRLKESSSNAPELAEEPQNPLMSLDADFSASGSQKYTCQFTGCGKSFQRKIRLRAHMHLHNGTQPYKCPDKTCGKAFSEK